MKTAGANESAIVRQIERASQRLRARCEFCELFGNCTAVEDEGPDLLLFEKGEQIYRSGDRDGRVYCVRKGSVKTTRSDPGGEEQVMGFYFAGEVFGIEGLLVPARDTEATALESTVLCRLSLQMPPTGDHSDRLLRLFGAEVLYAREHALVNRRQSGVRLAAFLLDVASRSRCVPHEDDVVFPLPMNRYEIASYLGLTVETVCRRLCALEREKLLAISDRRKTVQLLNVEGLRQMVYPDIQTST